ncbi:DUF1275 family protein [Arthrobacter halodurans]|uniref:DUF1275 family protein n=1 Tax=Arthrobacter halodurans TaxID=516699 RepID=A0ABV4UQY1_9MICC
MLALTFSTGIVDAIGFLALDRVFTGNMTGNVVILGMAMTGATDLPVVGPLVALLMFFLGAMLAGRRLRGSPDGWSPATTVIFATVAICLALEGLAFLVFGATVFPYKTEAAAAVLGFVMGAQAAAARKVKVADVTTVVVTSTLTALAAESRFGAGTDQPWVRRVLAVTLILLGALAGAALLTVGLWVAFALSTAVTTAVLILGHRRMKTEDTADG